MAIKSISCLKVDPHHPSLSSQTNPSLGHPTIICVWSHESDDQVRGHLKYMAPGFELVSAQVG